MNVIWQRDANSVAWRALEACAVPPYVVNVTGRMVAVRELAATIADRMGVSPQYTGEEAPTALLSDPSRGHAAFGVPATSLETIVERSVAWWRQGGRGLGKPTQFDVRDGAF